jgi:hypothetical protein
MWHLVFGYSKCVLSYEYRGFSAADALRFCLRAAFARRKLGNLTGLPSTIVNKINKLLVAGRLHHKSNTIFFRFCFYFFENLSCPQSFADSRKA